MSKHRTPRALTIAGSDSGGGAGIQADLKAFASCGLHGMSAVTAVTAQNTLGVEAIYELPAEIIVAQVHAVVEDIGVDAVKVGMLASTTVIEAVGAALDLLPGVPVVLDPVMVSESGSQLLEPAAVSALTEILLPRATVITPNLIEAATLAADGFGNEYRVEDLVKALHALGPDAVVVTGGHGGGAGADDIFYDGDRLEWIPGERYEVSATHGSGCTHSSALAAYLAKGFDPLEAARQAKQVAAEAVHAGLEDIGSGAGPVDVLGIDRSEAFVRHVK